MKKNKFATYLLAGMIGISTILPTKLSVNKNDLESKVDTNLAPQKIIEEKPTPEYDKIPNLNAIIEKRIEEKRNRKSSFQKEIEIFHMSKILYAEAASQSSDTRRSIGELILKRVDSPQYPGTVENVIYQKNAFHAVIDERNKNTRQMYMGEKSTMNEYEKKVFKECASDARKVINGEEKVLGEENIIAYCDWSMSDEEIKNHPYFGSLDEKRRQEKLIFFAPKEDNTKYSQNENNVIDASKRFGLLSRMEKIRNDNDKSGLLVKAQEYLRNTG